MSANIFVSSTPFDLALHRKKIAAACALKDPARPDVTVLMALPETTLAARLQMVRNAKVYIGIFAMVCGDVDSKSKKPLLQLEYEEALAHGIPVLIYIIDEDEHLVLPKHVDTGVSAQKLSDFKTLLSQSQPVRFYESADDLVAKIQNDLFRVISLPVVVPPAKPPAPPVPAPAPAPAPAPEVPPIVSLAARRYALNQPRFEFFKDKVKHLFTPELPDQVLKDVLEYILGGNTMSASSALCRGAKLPLEDAIEEVRKTELIIFETVQRYQAQLSEPK
ncbi:MULTISPECIES: DUF4062 domain-containing protein [unclassified Undibacterium]|uniref:DUF4062 domain-containing protein n=1 Tax=unclassified Undibacterium TaxID=2630295 RepID=UPI002AC96253|nr:MULTISPECIES: DUF4062 domain-containing protein [unclassified Undibacterium]MEB0140483.1 DUF4062 domain-containing protein [Undibacterium sp. CCC2.1]MEB0173726.1 DUF4062 domain-containing protein [Undibacterium sp. CCC1.1]MEB0177726.1 DUF4062 domain-containing protein [Undibacterium sp. CCC3.4]MEB0217023.1 DUF4062 domain-containing protein [Undibacterium sp. 5I2]WPX44614.1 DUF4062 domain-containing protein [Undibacterium sp. CCC3.4]